MNYLPDSQISHAHDGQEGDHAVMSKLPPSEEQRKQLQAITGCFYDIIPLTDSLLIEQRQMKAMPVVEIVEVGTEPLCVRWGKPKNLKHFTSAGLWLGE